LPTTRTAFEPCGTWSDSVKISANWARLLVGAPLIFMFAFFIVPFTVVVLDSFRTKDGQLTFDNYAKALGEIYYWDTLFLTFKLSLFVVVFTFFIGYPLAYFIVRHVRSRLLRSLLYIVVITPLFTSNIVRAFGWMVLLGRRGLVNDALQSFGITDGPLPLLYGQFSIVLGLTYIMAPFMVLTVASVLQNIDRSVEEASYDLGASAWQTFINVTLPLSLPGVVAGSLIVFTLSVSAYVTPSILSGGRQNVTSMLIFQQYGTILNFQFGAALAVVLLAASLILIAGYLKALSRGRSLA
jgi:putative spermidine/putrescine transport system permease protein